MLYLHNTPELIKVDKHDREYVDIKYLSACGRLYVDGTVVVLAGSKIEELKPSATEGIIKVRDVHRNFVSNKTITQDIQFKSASGAAKFVYGQESNGYIMWCNNYNKYIDMYRVELEKPMIIKQNTKEQRVEMYNGETNSIKVLTNYKIDTGSFSTDLFMYMYITNEYGVPSEHNIDLFINTFCADLRSGSFKAFDMEYMDNLWLNIYRDAIGRGTDINCNYGWYFYRQISLDTDLRAPKIDRCIGMELAYYKDKLKKYIRSFRDTSIDDILRKNMQPRLKELAERMIREKLDFRYRYLVTFPDNQAIIRIGKRVARVHLDTQQVECSKMKYTNFLDFIDKTKTELTDIANATFMYNGHVFSIKKLFKNKIIYSTHNILDDYNVKDLGDNEILAPVQTVKDMVELIPLDTFKPNSKFLDAACKSARFLIAIRDKLMSSPWMIQEFPNKRDRLKHILDNQLYGISLSKSSQMICTRALYGELVENSNIRYIQGYFSNIENKDISTSTIVSIIQKEFEIMEFDVIIGNPPYNDSTDRGNGGGGNALYIKFVTFSAQLAKLSSLIIPSAWMLSYPQGCKHKDVDNVRSCMKFSILHDFKDSTVIFDNVSIPGGVCYYLIDSRKKNIQCDHFIHNVNGSVDRINNMPLYNSQGNVIFRDKHILNLIRSIENVDGVGYETFDINYAGNKDYFDDGRSIMITTWDDYKKQPDSKNSIKYYVNEKKHYVEHGYVSYNQIPKHQDDYKKHKIIIGEAFTAGSPQVIDIPKYIGNNSVCSQSFIPIFSRSNTEQECINIICYMKTKFFRFLVQSMKADQHLSVRTFSLIPIQDFSYSWTDQMLYEKYGLTQEEIDYIESTIKPME